MKDLNVKRSESTEFEFDLKATGVDLKQSDVYLTTQTSDTVKIQISCVKQKGPKWIATIPKNTFKVGTHIYVICAIVDNYFFEIFKGKMNVFNGNNAIKLTQESQTPVEESDSDKNILTDSVKNVQPDQNNSESKQQQITEPDTDLVNEPVIEDGKEDITESNNNSEQQLEEIQTNGKSLSNQNFRFITTPHPYATLKDNGQKDAKVRRILKLFNKNH